MPTLVRRLRLASDFGAGVRLIDALLMRGVELLARIDELLRSDAGATAAGGQLLHSRVSAELRRHAGHIERELADLKAKAEARKQKAKQQQQAEETAAAAAKKQQQAEERKRRQTAEEEAEAKRWRRQRRPSAAEAEFSASAPSSSNTTTGGGGSQTHRNSNTGDEFGANSAPAARQPPPPPKETRLYEVLEVCASASADAIRAGD